MISIRSILSKVPRLEADRFTSSLSAAFYRLLEDSNRAGSLSGYTHLELATMFDEVSYNLATRPDSWHPSHARQESYKVLADAKYSHNDILLFYWPSYTNPYQSLLYRNVSITSRAMAPDKLLNECRKGTIVGSSTVYHQHWVKEPEGADELEIAKEYLSRICTLIGLKIENVYLVWTVHNPISHECTFPSLQLFYRNILARLFDLTHLHEYCHKEILESTYGVAFDEIVIQRHPLYPPIRDVSDEETLETDLPIRVAWIGMLRRYKNISLLVNLIETLAELPSVNFSITASYADRSVSDIIKATSLSKANITVSLSDGFIPDDTIDEALQTAHFGLITNTSILNSGTLFKYLSHGLGIISPPYASLPQDMVPGNNFVAYNYSIASLIESLRALVDSEELRCRIRLGSHRLLRTYSNSRADTLQNAIIMARK